MKSPIIMVMVATLASVSVYSLPTRVSLAAIQDTASELSSLLQIVKRDEENGIPEVIPPDATEDENGRPFETTLVSSPSSAASEPVDRPSVTTEVTAPVSELASGEGTSAGINFIVAVAAQATTTAITISDDFNALDVLTAAAITYTK